ncbi:MAG TPA: hypothetical protein VNQ90_09580 [Chthoniobacteraceae bacterium]|nr:hypothetical protein [Chthoniobacteraceae bacterium]
MKRPLEIILCALLLFAAAFFLFTRENRFAFYYHSDEPGKTRQVVTGEWNFHHPMLLVTATRLAVEATGLLAMENNGQRVTETGRNISAAFTAGAAALLMASVWLLAGRFAAIAAGLLLLTNRQLFELAHYFKEDTALLFGVACWFFALVLFWRRPSTGRLLLLGAGAGLAASGKTLGLFALPLSLGLLAFHPALPRRWSRIALFGLSFLMVVVAINFPAVTEWSAFRQSFRKELNLAVGGHGGMTRSIPHDVYLTAFRANVIFVLWPLILWYYVRCWRERRSLSGAEKVVALFPVLYLAILSFAPKTNDRYFLPATALFLCTAAMGMSLLRDHLARRGLSARAFGVASIALIVVGVAAQLPYKGVPAYYGAFRVDDTADLAAWLNIHLPDARLAIDDKVMLPSPKYDQYAAYQPEIKAPIAPKPVEDFADVGELRRAGVTHVVLTEAVYGRYKLERLRPKSGFREEYERKKELYADLLAGEPLWTRDRGIVVYLHPGLVVLAVPPAAPATPAATLP